MTSTRTPKFILKTLIIAIAIACLGGYSLFESRNIIRGPIVKIESPRDGGTVVSQIIEIKGEAKNISHISLNDRQIFVDKNGVFNEKLSLSPGYNVMRVKANDKFGREVNKSIELVFSEPDKSVAMKTATSSNNN